ncbi:MAG: hypothetical protein HRT45_16795, partial [Bdellovibrionales bacterium]|nr:hypothetical protein [Bdellovibrionales bacterium]
MKRFPVAIAAICIGIFVSTSQLAVAQDKDQRSCPAELNKNGPDAIFRMLTEQGVAKAFDQRGEEIESDLALMNAALEAYQEAGGKQDSGTR